MNDMKVVGPPSHAPSVSPRASKVLIATTCLLLLVVTFHFTVSSGSASFDRLPYVGSHFTQPAEVPTRQLLPVEAAQEICSRRRLDVYTTRDKSRKVFDLFTINTELDWLEVRLGELHEEVDYFVIVESNTTFQGGAKPLYLKENWARFQKFHYQIIYREIDLTGHKFEDSWAREGFHRNAIYEQIIPFLDGDQKAELNDILIVSDIDEIPQPSTVVTLRNCAIPARVALHSDLHYYSFQWRRRSGGWNRLKATYYAGNDTILPGNLRDQPADIELMHASWHCSSCLPTLHNMIVKIESFSHEEFHKPEFLDRAKILQRVRTGHDLFDRRDLIYDRFENNHNVPAYILKSENREKFAYLTNRDPPSGNFLDFKEEDLAMTGDVSWTPPSAHIPPPQ